MNPAAQGDVQARLDFVRRLTRGQALARTLEKHHITGVAISGTVGAGLFITSGEIIGLSGSLGSFLAYLFAGAVVASVMLCLSEMVSVRPLAGALVEFPKLYFDPALGFATGIVYWLAYTFSAVTLTVSAAMLLDFWDFGIWQGILVSLVPIWIFNFFGPVLWYGRLEWSFKWLKLFLILGLSILMIVIAAGVGSRNAIPSHGKYWTAHNGGLFPPGFSSHGYHGDDDSGPEIKGAWGSFLGFWTSCTLAVFAFIGVEMVIVTAGEARYPRQDLPVASRWIYIFAIVVYTLLDLLASLNVRYDDPALLPYNAKPTISMSAGDRELFPHSTDGTITTGERSPFIIAVIRAGFTRENSALPHFLNGCLYFAALTAANTAVYVSSRTLFSISKTSGNRLVKGTLGRTSFGGLPLVSIGVTIVLSCTAFLGAIPGQSNLLVGVFSGISTTSILCVYFAQCITFIRFIIGMEVCEYDRADPKGHDYPEHNWYRSGLHQPLPAVFGAIVCFLLIFFNGWDTFYRIHHHDITPAGIAASLFRAYFGPVLFVGLFVFRKVVGRTRIVAYQQFDSHFNPPDEGLDDIGLESTSRWKRFLEEAR